ncbi:restriction endonuclease subunit S [Streptomyces sp. sk226]|uniref:restriction endonuclease subunit S n=1 Tax=Streptomyces sp. sk226 TaxID=2034268 RepID=UPI000D1C4DA4|nr:restriction endonuclease subunit S [Streptomyces sp. sk226]
MTFSPSWPTRRARFMFSVRDVRGTDAPLASATKDGVSLRSDLDFSVWNPDSNVSNYKLVESDDFVIGLRSFQHGISHSTVKGIVSPAYTVLRAAADVDPRFFRHYFRSSLLISQLANLTQGIRQGQAIDIETFRDLPLPLPPREEQRRIADFLDAETARMDKLVLRQEQIAKKLDERERVQLDLAVDQLAEHWGVVPLRRFLLGVDQGTSPQAEAVPAGLDEWGVLKVSCLRPGRFIPDENKRLPSDVEPDSKHEVQAGDLLITRANTPQLVGSTAVVQEARAKLLLSDKIFRVRLDRRMTGEFVAMVARGTRIRDLCAASSNGASQSMANIRFEEVKTWPLPAADLDAQNKAVRHVDQQRAHLDGLRTKIARQNVLLAERRQSLITAAVTGQFDVSTASGRNVTE